MKYIQRAWIVLLANSLLPLSVQADTLRIGLLTELTGSDAPNGEHCKNGFDAAKNQFFGNEKHNFPSVEFIYGDNGSSAAGAVSEFRKLTSVEKVDVVLSTRSQMTMAFNPISKSTKVPLIGVVGHAKYIEENPYAYRAWPSVAVEGPALAGYAIKQGVKKIAILTAEDEWTLALRKHFIHSFEAAGGKVVFSDSVVSSEQDFSSLVGKIKQAEPEMIFINLTLVSSGSAVKRLRELGVTTPIIGNFWSGNPEVITTAGKENSEGIVFAVADLEKPNFLAGVKAISPLAPPNAVTYSCYLGLALVHQALTRAPTATSKKEVHAALDTVTAISTPDGVVPVVDHEIHFSLKFQQIHNGEIANLK